MNYFFIGIKGSGMSALSLILKDMGNKVLGSDVPKHFFTENNLINANIPIYNFGEFDFSNIDKVVLGNSFDESNIDYIKAKEAGIEIVRYYEMLDEVMGKYESVAVCGANGKTTTMGLLVSSFKNEPISYLIGDGKGSGVKDASKFFFEACEYKNTFLNYNPKFTLINNIVFDHPDFFKDIDDMINSFQAFADQSNVIVINGDDENCQKINHGNKYTFGLGKHNNLYADNIEYLEDGIKFNLIYNEENLGTYSLPFFGEYMLLNSLGVILVNILLNKEVDVIIDNITTFEGVSRRFSETVLNKEDNTFLIDDYAHHPTAIKETLKAIRQKHPQKEVISIFQAHTQSRVNTFFKDFAKELSSSDKVIVLDTFKAAREKEENVEQENKILNELTKLGEVSKIINVTDLKNFSNNFVICLFGAGDIDLLYKEKLIENFKK